MHLGKQLLGQFGVSIQVPQGNQIQESCFPDDFVDSSQRVRNEDIGIDYILSVNQSHPIKPAT